MIELHRDPGPGTSIERLPRFAIPRRPDGYWHIPRSARAYDGRILVKLWCGTSASRRVDFTDEQPAEMLCGTCAGRSEGYLGEERIFRPRDHWALPTWCPGSDRGDGRCRACLSPIRYRRRGFFFDQSPHRPTLELFARCEPCPEHGWSRFNGEMVCTGWDCREWRGLRGMSP